jgi:5-methylcytosine-specific restriction enzyme A
MTTRSAEASAWHRLYDLQRWRKLRRTQLADHPLCKMCLEQSHVVPATVVDHIQPHKGNPTLMWSRNNLQSLCKVHHDSAKRYQETRDIVVGCDAKGTPIDPRHPWHSR